MAVIGATAIATTSAWTTRQDDVLATVSGLALAGPSIVLWRWPTYRALRRACIAVAIVAGVPAAVVLADADALRHDRVVSWSWGDLPTCVIAIALGVLAIAFDGACIMYTCAADSASCTES